MNGVSETLGNILGVAIPVFMAFSMFFGLNYALGSAWSEVYYSRGGRLRIFLLGVVVAGTGLMNLVYIWGVNKFVIEPFENKPVQTQVVGQEPRRFEVTQTRVPPYPLFLLRDLDSGKLVWVQGPKECPRFVDTKVGDQLNILVRNVSDGTKSWIEVPPDSKLAPLFC